MPELPEVETIVRGLRKKIVGSSFTSYQLRQPRMRQEILSSEIDVCLQQEIIGLRRFGKYFVLDFQNSYSLLFHLGMSGKLFLAKQEEIPERHVIIVFVLSSLSKEKAHSPFLVFADVRRFGVLRGVHSSQLLQHELLKNIAADPLSKKFSWQALAKKARRSNRNIKDFIMDQQVVSGLGNIYACELLFRLRLHPQTYARTLSDTQWQSFATESRELLRFAIQKQGSSVSDYVNSGGQKGGFQFFFSVYKQEKQPCAQCGSLIVRVKQGGRSTFFCPHCQKARV